MASRKSAPANARAEEHPQTGSKRPAAPRKRKTTAEKWTPAKREQFLAELARSCNVTASAGAVKLPERSAYALRAKNPTFREAWAEALRAGYQALEMRLVARSIAAMESGEEPEAATKQADAQALRLLAAHRDAAPGATSGKAKPLRSPLAAIDRALARHEAKTDG